MYPDGISTADAVPVIHTSSNKKSLNFNSKSLLKGLKLDFAHDTRQITLISNL